RGVTGAFLHAVGYGSTTREDLAIAALRSLVLAEIPLRVREPQSGREVARALRESLLVVGLRSGVVTLRAREVREQPMRLGIAWAQLEGTFEECLGVRGVTALSHGGSALEHFG